ncbi:hypothetical protein [Actinoplanes xinjiangensis]|uniref:Uncharacterized protein n=1 Tax=Actinoplanes xinjiangensis TaxID=512350 RepID=A0A316FC85_9ACTN|nr:hypothetical protein [Actinoplanes xinjiangensis]PWK45096.1 hypothetical protein BC793_11169 [Actinoplanes xinjiangensis]
MPVRIRRTGPGDVEAIAFAEVRREANRKPGRLDSVWLQRRPGGR